MEVDKRPVMELVARSKFHLSPFVVRQAWLTPMGKMPQVKGVGPCLHVGGIGK